MDDSTPPKLSSFPLLELPIELIHKICVYVALQRYDYAPSRRPTPSPLSSLASSHSVLYRLASPLLWRRRKTSPLYDLWGGGAEGRTLRNGRHVALLELDLTWPGGDSLLPPFCEHRYLPAVSSLELRYRNSRGVPSSGVKLDFPNIKTLYLRNGRGPALPYFDFSHLTRLSITFCGPEWLCALANFPNVTHLSTSLTADHLPLRQWLTSATLGRLESLVLDLPPRTSRQFAAEPKGFNVLEYYTRGLEVRLTPLQLEEVLIVLPQMPDSAALRHLQITVRREPASFGDSSSRDRIDLRLTSHHLRAFAGVRSLVLDEWMIGDAAAVGELAEVFPRLTALKFGSGTAWQNTKANSLSLSISLAALTMSDRRRRSTSSHSRTLRISRLSSALGGSRSRTRTSSKRRSWRWRSRWLCQRSVSSPSSGNSRRSNGVGLGGTRLGFRWIG